MARVILKAVFFYYAFKFASRQTRATLGNEKISTLWRGKGANSRIKSRLVEPTCHCLPHYASLSATWRVESSFAFQCNHVKVDSNVQSPPNAGRYFVNSILSEADLFELSGLKQGAAQAKFLQRAYGLNVPQRPDGRVRVTWEAINQALTRTKVAPAQGPRWTK